MADKLFEGVHLTPLKIIPNENGNILHGIKNSDTSYNAFGEAYFSLVNKGARKGWKKHTRMILNVIVPVGEIGFILFDDRPESPTRGLFYEVKLSRDNYMRLTVPPNVWMAFYGCGDGENMLLNVASIPHDPTESENLPIENDLIKYMWA